MSKQMSIYDQAERAKQEGIEVVYRNANTTWKRAAADQLMKVIAKRRTFTSDDVLIPSKPRTSLSAAAVNHVTAHR